MYKVDVIWDLLKIGQPSDFLHKSSKETNRNVEEAKEIFLSLKHESSELTVARTERAALRYEVCEAFNAAFIKKIFQPRFERVVC